VGSETDVFLLETDRPEVVTAVSHALTDAGIPYRTGLQVETPAWVAFFVPPGRLERAQRIVRAYTSDGDGVLEDDEETPALEMHGSAAEHFPWPEIRTVAAVVLAHLALLFASGGHSPLLPGLREGGAILAGRTLAEPWRLISAMFLHVDLRHVFWNGVSMLVFAVPLLLYLGRRRTGLIYLAAGVGGGICAAWLARPGTLILGSSGAVAGLFGAWVVLTLRRARQARLGWRGRVRSLGIALLVLPSLLSPTNAQGHPVSVASHVGGLLTGMLIGGVISRRFLVRRTEPTERATG